jgi:hypothetical protein
MPTTANLLLPYPALTAAPNVPADLQAIADRIEAVFATGGAAMPAPVPRGKLGVSQVTVSQTGITAATDLTGLSVAVTVGTSRRIKISAMVHATGSVANDVWRLSIAEGATVLQYAEVTIPTGGIAGDMVPFITFVPTSGAHTYKLVVTRTSGTGNFASNADATRSAFILVEDIGV